MTRITMAAMLMIKVGSTRRFSVLPPPNKVHKP